MKHSKNYLDAKWVVENSERYDDRDVARANSFIEAYNEGYSQVLIGTAINIDKTTCPDCGDRGWLYVKDGRRAGVCPCHY